MKFNTLRTALLTLTGTIAFASSAFADCDKIATNQEFKDGVISISRMVEAKQYDEAIEAAKPLFAICKESPVLLYYTGVAFREKGENERATKYFQQSTANIKDFNVEPGLTEKIWFAYYEAEHPTHTEASVQAKDTTIADLTKQLEEQKIANINLANTTDNAKNKTSENLEIFNTLMWTGAGLGIAGVALAVTGGVLVLKDGEIDVAINTFAGSATKKESLPPTKIAYYTMLGAGIGMTVVGAVVAGIAGYQVTHLGKSSNDGVDVSLNLSPMSAGLNLEF